MSMQDEDVPQIYLKAGEIIFTDKPHIVLTVLGSCLTITMLHRRTGLSAISHGLLPHCRERAVCTADCKEMAKYVECSFSWMLKRFRNAKAPQAELEVKVFGGGDMFGRESREHDRGPITVGRQNIEIARKIIEKERLNVLSMDVGGSQGRKLFFNTATGEIMLKRLTPNVVLVDPAARQKK